MNISTTIRALSLAATLAVGVLGSAGSAVHAQESSGSGSAPKATCETLSGYYNPKTLEKYKAGTKLDEGTVVGDTYSGKQWTCNKDGAWQQVIRRAPSTLLANIPEATIAVAPSR